MACMPYCIQVVHTIYSTTSVGAYSIDQERDRYRQTEREKERERERERERDYSDGERHFHASYQYFICTNSTSSIIIPIQNSL